MILHTTIRAGMGPRIDDNGCEAHMQTTTTLHAGCGFGLDPNG